MKGNALLCVCVCVCVLCWMCEVVLCLGLGSKGGGYNLFHIITHFIPHTTIDRNL